MRLGNYLSVCKIASILFILLGCSNGNGSQPEACSREEVFPGSTPPGVFGPEIIRCPLWPDINLSLYEVIPSLEDKSLNWESVRPAEATDYWELRGPFGVISKTGEKCKTATNREACEVAFDTLTLDSGGFGPPHLPAAGFQYVASNHGNSNRVWDTLDKLKVFLGTINSREEAILLATGHEFFSGESEKENAAIREVDGEYELIVLKLVKFCFPIQTNRYLIRIESSGALRVLREQLYRQLTNTCA